MKLNASFSSGPQCLCRYSGAGAGGRFPERMLRVSKGTGRDWPVQRGSLLGPRPEGTTCRACVTSAPPRLFLLFSCLGWFGLEVEGWAILHGPLMPASQRSGSDSEAVFQELLFHCEMCPHSRAVPAGARGCPHLSFQTVC